MNKSNTARLLGALFLLGATSLAGNAWAFHGHHHVGIHYGVYLGSPWPYYPYGYYPPLYYPQPQVIVQSPPVYIEQSYPQPAPVNVAPPPAVTPPAAPVAAPENYWYYCSRPQGYYPYIKECKVNWQPVAPQPPAAASPR